MLMLNKLIHKVFEIFPRLMCRVWISLGIPNHRDFTEFDL